MITGLVQDASEFQLFEANVKVYGCVGWMAENHFFCLLLLAATEMEMVFF